MALKENIYEILKAYTEKNHIAASSVILEEYAEEVAKSGLVVEVVRCKDCKRWVECGYDPIFEHKWGECHRPLGEEGGLRETEENDFCSYGAKMDGKGEDNCKK